MSGTEQAVQDAIVHLFRTNSSLYYFSMGVDCPDVRQVIHYGPRS